MGLEKKQSLDILNVKIEREMNIFFDKHIPW